MKLKIFTWSGLLNGWIPTFYNLWEDPPPYPTPPLSGLFLPFFCWVSVELKLYSSLFWRVPAPSVCDPPSCGIFYGLRLHLPSWCFCPRNLSSAYSRKPGASWETVPHSLQPATALWTRANEPGTSTATATFPAAPYIFTSSANSTVYKPVAGSSSSSATAVPHEGRAGSGEKPSSPLWVPAGRLRCVDRPAEMGGEDWNYSVFG